MKVRIQCDESLRVSREGDLHTILVCISCIIRISITVDLVLRNVCELTLLDIVRVPVE